MARTVLRAGAWGLLSILLLAQDSDVSFRSATSLVLVPFNVERGQYYAEDLQASDFTLREDGHPRAFTIFESPHSAPAPLELDLLFDTSVLPKPSKDLRIVGKWSAKDTYEFLNDWDAATTGTILHQNGMDVRIGVYHFEASRWERLCAGTNDPQTVVAALRRILDPIPAGQGEMTAFPDSRPQPHAIFMSPGWLGEATAATLRDAAESPVRVRHILIWFSKGWPGHLPFHTDLLAGQAAQAGITIYPVIVDFAGFAAITDTATGSFSVSAQTADGATRFVNAPASGKLGEMTGGQLFIREHINRDALARILTGIRNKSISGYQLGFEPEKSAKPRRHDLEVRLTSKDKGKLVGGRRGGVVY